VSKVRTILESQSPKKDPKPGEVTTVPTAEIINMRTDPRHFESFLRSIGRINSLLDARRLKNDIIGEMRRTRALLGNYFDQFLGSFVS
jgi:sorting nexin-25